MSTRTPWIAAGLLLMFSLGVAGQGVLLLGIGFNEVNFAENAGINWDAFAADNPEAASAMDAGRDGRMFGVTATALGIQTLVLVWLALRKARPVPASLVGLAAVAQTGWGVILLPTSDFGIALGNLLAGIAMLGLVWLARPVLSAGRSRHER